MSGTPGPRPAFELIGGERRALRGSTIESRNPARPAHLLWSAEPSPDSADLAVRAARRALPEWAARPFEHRAAVLRRFAALASARLDEITALLRDEVGKPAWDARAEAQLLAGKVEITLDPGGPLARVRDFELSLGETRRGFCRFRPHGVMAVLGPFNFPVHLPNGHIVPALAMGNTIAFKPSDKAPASGQLLAELFDEALRAEGAPPGVFNLIHGGAKVAESLVAHDDIDGILFTGSWLVGRRILQANLDRPGRMIALEMGGSSAAIVLPDADLKQAVVECVRSAFIGAGQRCTCTRRLILHKDIAARVLPALCKMASTLILGDPAADHPVFLGPLITEAARRAVLDAQALLLQAGGDARLLTAAVDAGEGGYFCSPGVMLVDRFTREGPPDALAASGAPLPGPGCDIEVFGPFLRVSIADSLDDALEQANATRFGLVCSIFTRDSAAIEHFLAAARAGCLNVNTGTAGANSRLPFGGLGLSGNHRPAGAFSLDYCAYPAAGMLEHGPAATLHPGMKFDDSWLK